MHWTAAPVGCKEVSRTVLVADGSPCSQSQEGWGSAGLDARHRKRDAKLCSGFTWSDSWGEIAQVWRRRSFLVWEMAFAGADGDIGGARFIQ